ncbi:MAG: hypothetical protein R3234_14070 [Thermoanaerobaculia bacterium]|nr:hypothetical protein [Thermoanaerobaculia bacterium]
MSERPESDTPEPDTPEPPSTGEILRRLQAGVRQRTAELTTVTPSGEDDRLRLAELQRVQFVEEPLCVSPRPVLGRLLVFLRKVVHRLFVRWYSHPLLQQQNRFNSVASSLIQELLEENRELRRRIDRLEGSRDADRDG